MKTNDYLFKIKNIKFVDIFSIFPFLIAIIPGILVRKKRPDLWLVNERKDESRDNGYWLFKHIREKYPQIDIVYAIKKLSPDYERIYKLGKVIQHGSLKHWIYYLAASKLITTQKTIGAPNVALCYFLLMSGIIKKIIVFLQHGVTKDRTYFLDYKVTRFTLFSCAAKREYEYVSECLHYPKGSVKLVGFCRFDNLYTPNGYKKNQILIMPTWRNWIAGEIGQSRISNFRETEYFVTWDGLLKNKDLLGLLKKYDLHIKFYQHSLMQKYMKEFISTSERVIITDWQHYDVQDLLKDSCLLITDYSSVAMDFAYMRKPLIYYQFDQQEFRNKQYQEGYFSYENDGFGEIALSAMDLLEKLEEYAKSNFSPKDNYLKRIEQFYAFFDTNNCERTFRAILDINTPPKRLEKKE
jgi:CDP-glycerol glycerophosphotransferase (TagB/SpsB family)